ALTGEDEPEKCGTTTWSKVEENPDGTFYFDSPANKPAFAKWRSHLSGGMTMPEDKEFSKS
ncbi:MAG: hypothetical protein KDI11_06545, partial [Alphaproteobacteria bacterium]|nr:hypothetical protein [Alphaproteobacteria bacterium]